MVTFPSLHASVMTARQQKDDVPSIKDKWVLFSCNPSMAQSHVIHIHIFTLEP